jgi:formate hydrogenlyase subunit 4
VSQLVHVLASLVLLLGLAPLLPGIVTRVKALVAGRRGPPLGQLYFDLARLWRKEIVLSTLVSPGFWIGPAVAWVAIVGAALLVPIQPFGAVVSFDGDMLLFVSLLALARFATVWAALETGSAFEGLGASREVSFAVLSEAALVTALVALCVQSGATSLAAMLTPTSGAAGVLLAVGLFLVLLAENCRVPFDDPATHLELTMIHEVMVLDHSGPLLATILHGAAVKLLCFTALLVNAVLPLQRLHGYDAGGVLAALAWIGGVLAVTVAIGLVESFSARSSFRRVPLLLTTAFLLCFFALLVAWKAGGA